MNQLSHQDDESVLLHIEALSKTFPGQVALNDVTLDVTTGTTHALVGQNGSGKSTLIKVLAGYHQPDPGALATINGNPLKLGNGHSAAANGIRFVHQDLGLVPTVSTVENMRLGVGYETGRFSRINWRREADRAEQALEELGFPTFDVRAPVRLLRPAQRTAVAIARALQGWQEGASLLVLDEPTASLPGADVERLFEAVRRLRQRGVAILYVSHHLDEIFGLCDEVTVLRDGNKVATVPTRELDHGSLIELIVGRRVEAGVATETRERQGDPKLRVTGVSGATARNVSLDVYPGEVVGLAGITGSGRESVIPLVTGQIPRDHGRVEIGSSVIPNYDPKTAVGSALSFVAADRSALGIVPLLSVRANLTLTGLKKHVSALRLRHKLEAAEAKVWIEKLQVKTSGDGAAISTLSGGNQQKVLFGRSLRTEPKVLLLDEPTRGVDIGAKEEIHQLVDQAAQGGAAVLVASTDTEELVRLCQRVLIIRNGSVAESIEGAQVTTENIEHAQLMGGIAAS